MMNHFKCENRMWENGKRGAWTVGCTLLAVLAAAGIGKLVRNWCIVRREDCEAVKPD
ncbi:MAG: hypothetical protein AAB214_12635 [Fibrobacterota bacterium]